MANIIYRTSLTPELPQANVVKNAPLTNAEVDANFKSLNNDLATKSNTTHSHGDVSSTGSIGTTQGLPIITGPAGKLIAGNFGSTAGTFCEGDDPRLNKTSSVAGGQAGSLLYQSSINVTSFIPIGSSGQVLQVNSTGVPSWTSSPTFNLPALGTPVSGNLVNCSFPILNQDTNGTSLSSKSILSDEAPSLGQKLKFSKNAKSGQPSYIWGSNSDGSSSYIYDPINLKAGTVESIGSKLLSTNGYQKFPGGLTIQWGVASDTSSILFQLEYTNIYTAVATRTTVVDANTPELSISYNSSGITSINGPASFTWISIGFITP